MKVAIMQPYFFPYIGYFQLIHSVDLFVIYDDVNFIKKGWINRNQLIIRGEEHLFTLPVEKLSQNKKIRELFLKDDSVWWNKFSKNLHLNFFSSPFFNETSELFHQISNFQDRNLANFVGNSIEQICSHLNLKTKTMYSSELNVADSFTGEQRILEICKILGASTYINAINGKHLYSKEHFSNKGIDLRFISLKKDSILSFNPYLSTLQALFEVGKQEFFSHLNDYELN